MPKPHTDLTARIVTRRNLLSGSAAAGLSMLAASPLLAQGENVTTPTAPPSRAKSAGTEVAGSEGVFGGWTTAAPREEIRPKFMVEPTGGPGGKPALLIAADSRQGLDGWWKLSFPVTGGQHVKFSALYRAERVELPRRSVLVKIDWFDAAGKKVALEGPVVKDVLPGMTAMAETEFPAPVAVRPDGWTQIEGTYRVPPKATQAIVQLHLQWAANAEVRWADISLTGVEAPSPRIARLATIHFKPRGKTAEEQCRLYEPLIAEAAKQKADLIVLGETLTYAFTGKKMHEVAEAVPGPSTQYFGELAKKHNTYIVAGLVERDGHLIYNAAALLGPDG